MIPVRVEYRLKGPGTNLRFLIFVLCAVAGISLQLLAPRAADLGFLLLAAPLALLAAKPWTNRPSDQGEEDWQPAGVAELDRLSDSFRASAKIRVPYWFKPFSGIPPTIVLAMLAIVSVPLDGRLSLFFVDALILLWPAMHFLRVKIWIPRDLRMSLQSVMAALSADIPAGIVVTPYLRLDRDASGLRIPEDVRLMAELRRGPADLVGVQIQSTINNGPNGPVPYLYAVVLTRGKGPTWRIAAALKQGGFVVESGGDDVHGTVVIRQETSGGGYHTDQVDCHRLMVMVVEFLKAVSA